MADRIAIRLYRIRASEKWPPLNEGDEWAPVAIVTIERDGYMREFCRPVKLGVDLDIPFAPPPPDHLPKLDEVILDENGNLKDWLPAYHQRQEALRSA
jgi:hypothetical protein